MKYRYLFFLLSALVIVPGLVVWARFGLPQAIDFTGGSLLEIQVTKPHPGEEFNQAGAQALLGKDDELVSFQVAGPNQYILRGKPLTNEQKDKVIQDLQKGLGTVQELQFANVGPTLGAELLRKTILAGLFVAAIIILYVWSQFHSVKFGVAAVLAMIHDGLVVLGAFAIFGKLWGVEVDVLFVTALLTVLSFSVHDTIIVFDRIREMSRLHPQVPFRDVVNGAILQTLGRSIKNSFTVILMLTALVVLGGQSIHWFAVALLVGAITGTYSSTFTAAPILVVWDEAAAWLKHRRWQKNQHKVNSLGK